MHPLERHRIDAERQQLVEALEASDERAGEWLAERRAVIEQARDLHDLLWPHLPDHRTRRPPRPGGVPLPPLVDDPDWLRGIELRSVCMALLERHGPLRLVELHGLLHLYGFAVESKNPVKAVADAMGREARARRAQRMERGVYGVAEPSRDRRPDGLPDPPDPVLRLAAERWWHGWPEPGQPGSTLRRWLQDARRAPTAEQPGGGPPPGFAAAGAAPHATPSEGPPVDDSARAGGGGAAAGGGSSGPAPAGGGGSSGTGAAGGGASSGTAPPARTAGSRTGGRPPGSGRIGGDAGGPGADRGGGLGAIEGLRPEAYREAMRILESRGAPFLEPPPP